MNSVSGCGVLTVGAGSGSVRSEAMNYSVENPVYPLTDPSVYWSDGLVSAAGKRVSPRTALYLPAVYQAVTRISGDVARCPLELYEEKEGAYRALVDDPLYRLTTLQPNREMDAYKFWMRVMVFRLVWNRAYIYVARDVRGQPAELLPLLPDRTEARRAGGVLYFNTEIDGEQIALPTSRVLHLEGVGFDNLDALELTRLMRDAWGLALAQIDFTSRVFRGGGRRGGVLEIPATMTKLAGDKLEEGFRRKYEDQGQWFTTVILRDNAKFHEAQMTLRDSQSIEGREESVRDVARAFNIRPGHLGVEGSGVYGNKQDDTRDYLDMTLRPHMTAIAMQCRTKLLAPERQSRQLFWHNTDDLLQLSVKEEFEAYGTGVERRIITSNEARGKIGYPPIEGGDVLANPNTTPGQAGNGEPGARHTDQPGGGSAGSAKPPRKPAGEDDEDELNLAHRELLRATVAGVVGVVGEKAQRAATSGKKFCAWLDEKLPAERSSLLRAIAPVARCILAASTSVPASAKSVHDDLTSRLQELASSTPEGQLAEAVKHFFQTWEPELWQPSEVLKSKAA